jgi:hypothetical protein
MGDISPDPHYGAGVWSTALVLIDDHRQIDDRSTGGKGGMGDRFS